MRARLHVRGAPSRVLSRGHARGLRCARDTAAAAGDLRRARPADGGPARRSALDAHARRSSSSENIDASERVVHLDARGRDRSPSRARARWRRRRLTGLTGLAVGRHARCTAIRTSPTSLSIDGAPIALRRHVLAFFQGNRYLLSDLVAHVVGAGRRRAATWSISTPASGCSRSRRRRLAGRAVTAVEGDRIAAADLDGERRGGGRRRRRPCTRRSRRSAAPIAAGARRAHRRSAAHRHVAGGARRRRFGLRARADRLRLVRRRHAGARCAAARRRRLRASSAIDAFDLFPNTPHVETVAVRRSRIETSQLRLKAYVLLCGGFEESFEQRAELARAPEVLRVPLDAEAEARGRILDRFDDAVGRRGGHAEARRDGLDRLMVPAVDLAGVARRSAARASAVASSESFSSQTSCARSNGWCGGTVRLCVERARHLRRDVLHERAAAGDVQHLHAAADREIGRSRARALRRPAPSSNSSRSGSTSTTVGCGASP